mmetsp:Transcript_9186/g.23263  ORF Transcript_9186/g.23263 Transcript_9186/m.23263 type:complete len:839 (+) Transcript_9186:131-2647(+)
MATTWKMLLTPLLLMIAEVLLVSVCQQQQQPSSLSFLLSPSYFVVDAFVLDIFNSDFSKRANCRSTGAGGHSTTTTSPSPSSRSRRLHNLRHHAVVNGFIDSGTSSSPPPPPTTSQQEDEATDDDGEEEGDQLKADRYESETMFDLLAGAVTTCLLESDKRRDAKGPSNEKLVSSSATNWINDRQSFIVKQLLDQCEIKLPQSRSGINRDDASSFIRWMKATPIPTIIDLSSPFLRQVANSVMTDSNLELIDQTRTQFLNRMVCRLILLPSGTPLSKPLWEPPAALVYGKLLYGGVTRYRQLVSTSSSSSSSSSPPKVRKAGERSEIKSTSSSRSTTWIQYGGTQRMYEGVDIGPACLLEVVLLPRGTTAAVASTTATTSSNSPSRNSRNNSDHDQTRDDDEGPKEGSEKRQDTDMTIYNFGWPPQDIFEMVDQDDDDHGDGRDRSLNKDGDSSYVFTPISQSGKDRNDAFENEFRNAVGGLQPQIDAIVRRVLDGRVLRPVDADSDTNKNATTASLATSTISVAEDETTAALAKASLEARELEILGLTPVRGLLLYGPPGTGKTLLARQIAKALRARAPKIVSAPELLDRWVGGSEKLVRQLFADAEAELASVNGDVTKSALHVIVIDEIDAVFRKRSAGTDSGEQTRASVVNQILAKLDGVNAIGNVLMVGMTNRRELLDEALLRPGRLEVQIEVPLPDCEGRREILQIHFDALRRKGRLSRPLCCAIEGIPYSSSSGAGLQTQESLTPSSLAEEQGKERKRDKFKNGVKTLFRSVVRPYPDLAEETNGFSGADLAGLVRSAGSLALARARQDGSGLDGLLITLEDARAAIREVKV